MSLDASQRQQLLALARASIRNGLHEQVRTPCPAPASRELGIRAATFVTLRVHSDLRGCCGSIDATRTVAEDVWHNAWASAFADPRFAPLTSDEFEHLSVHISVLSELEPLTVDSEATLLGCLRPGTDGLLLRAGARQATFLPAVWRQLPDPRDFVRQLKHKAGWPPQLWPHGMQAYRYTTESFGETDEP